jgi:uncharacterized protein YkwD
MRILFLAVVTQFLFTSFIAKEKVELKPEEEKLYQMLMDYRVEKGLKPIPLSAALTKVAKLHVYDLHTNHPVKGRCNLHSWSNKGKWSACCYTGNQASAECMWNKPKELTSYTGAGFEIAAYSTNMSAEVALDGWKNSKGHNEVMINKGTWKKADWQAVGVGITGYYAVIWFGKEEDK